MPVSGPVRTLPSLSSPLRSRKPYYLRLRLPLGAHPAAGPSWLPLTKIAPGESCGFGTSARMVATAAHTAAASKASVLTKAKKLRKGKGKGKVAQPAAEMLAATAENPADITWVPDASGSLRKVRLSKYRTLMLDSSYRPIAVINWQRAMMMDWTQKVDVLEYYNDVSIASASTQFPLPAVMRCRMYVQRPRRRSPMLISKRNILLRDRHTCQYCGSMSDLTVDHVLPVSKGGQFTWSNCVTACRPCNGKKGNKTLQQIGWVPKHPPREPNAHELAPLRLMPKVATEVQASAEHPWQDYVMPLLKNYAPTAHDTTAAA